MGVNDSERRAGIKELNKVLEEFEITTDLRISFFLGQAKHESRSGIRTLEGFNYEHPEKYFNEKYSNNSQLGNLGCNDGEHFRGAGYLHVTGRENYQNFSDYIKEKGPEDKEIMTKGYRVVGGTYNRPTPGIGYNDKGVIDVGKYAWQASGWFWRYGNPKKLNLNLYADEKDWEKICRAINFHDDDTFGTRNGYINEFYKSLTGQDLGLDENV